MLTIPSEHGIRYKTPRVRFTKDELAYWLGRFQGQMHPPGSIDNGMPASWDMIRQYGVHMLGGEQNTKTENIAATTTSNVRYQTLLSDSQFVALEIWAFVGYCAYFYSVDEGSAGNRNPDFFTLVSYTQPSVIAGNTTTVANQSGDLKARNLIAVYDSAANFAWEIFTAVGEQQVNMPAVIQPLLAMWEEPLRIVGPAIWIQESIQWMMSIISASDQWGTQITYHLLGRYVEIGLDEYARLAALASGQAIVTSPLVTP